MAADFATRLSGSADLFDRGGRSATASVNFITAHDGFTLADLVSYLHKHNEANGEDNRDGHGGNHSTNHGVEGPTDNPIINSDRARHRRNLMACLMMAQGTPMLLAGDEAGNSQDGNNNAYCQDNDIGWVNWQGMADADGQDFLEFVRRLTVLRRSCPVLRQPDFLHSRNRPSDGLPDLAWFRADGGEPSPDNWNDPGFCQFGVVVRRAAEADSQKQKPATLPGVAMLINRAAAGSHFLLPPARQGCVWSAQIDTVSPTGEPRAGDSAVAGGGVVHISGNAMIVLVELPDDNAGTGPDSR